MRQLVGVISAIFEGRFASWCLKLLEYWAKLELWHCWC